MQQRVAALAAEWPVLLVLVVAALVGLPMLWRAHTYPLLARHVGGWEGAQVLLAALLHLERLHHPRRSILRPAELRRVGLTRPPRIPGLDRRGHAKQL